MYGHCRNWTCVILTLCGCEVLLVPDQSDGTPHVPYVDLQSVHHALNTTHSHLSYTAQEMWTKHKLEIKTVQQLPAFLITGSKTGNLFPK